MCEPTTLMAMSLAITTAAAAKSYDDGRRTANQQTDALKDAAFLEGNDLQRQQSQQASAASEEMNQHAREALREQATAQAITGEYGGGNTAERGMNVAQIQQGERLATIASNAGKVDEQTRFTSLAAGRRTASQIRAIQQPSLLGTALTIGGAAARTYGDYKAGLKPKPPNTGNLG